MVAFASATLFSSPASVRQRGDHDYPLSSSPASVILLVPLPLSPESPIHASCRDFPSFSPNAELSILGLNLEAESTMSTTSTPPTKRKHQQSTLGSAFAAISSNTNVTLNPQTEKVASDEKRRRISTGWDELCRATIRARQAEERRRASGASNSPLGRSRESKSEAEPGASESYHTVNVRAESLSLRTGFSPFKPDMTGVDHRTAANDEGATRTAAEDVDMEVEQDDDVTPMSEDEVDVESEDDSSYATSRRRRPIIGSGFGDTRIGHRAMKSNLRAGKRYQREHCESSGVNPSERSNLSQSPFPHSLHPAYQPAFHHRISFLPRTLQLPLLARRVPS
jgi:hypothetical protein